MVASTPSSDPAEGTVSVPGQQSAWTPRQIAIAIFFVSYLTGHVLLPTVQLFRPKPTLFGWHMFADLPKIPQVYLLYESGLEIRQEKPFSYFGRVRGDINFRAPLVALLCRLHRERIDAAGQVDRLQAIVLKYPAVDRIEVCACR